MRSFRSLLAVAVLSASVSVSAAEAPPSKPAAEAPKALCEHGVKKALCTRCNAKLVPVFKAKGDWCQEHERPESQCVLCHPELAKQGVK